MRSGGLFATVSAFALVMACSPARPSGAPGATTSPGRAAPSKLAILGVESDAFPKVAAQATASLARVPAARAEARQVSKVSLEIVQLSIECVEPTAACYGAVARSFAADRLLFAQVARGDGRDAVIVKVTLFDAAAGAPRTSAREFASEREALSGIDGLVAEALR